MVGPDGDLYYEVLGNPGNGSRGWMLHFSSDLTQTKTPGAFGWDNTPSVVPASMVPSYVGTSSYLIFTKYNNYAGLDGGDGVNRIAVLDPNATMVEPHASSNGLLVMKEVLSIVGPTPDPEFPQFPNAVREWCINTAAVDPLTMSVMVNSEDGKLYRWNLSTNTLSETITLSPGIGEAYTPTIIGPDGTVYAINAAILNAVGRQTIGTTLSINAVIGDTINEPNETFVVNLSNPSNATIADGQGRATILNDDPAPPSLAINDVTVNEGNSGVTSATFTVTLSASSTQTVTVNFASADGTAKAATKDYTAVSGTLTFAPGVTSKTI